RAAASAARRPACGRRAELRLLAGAQARRRLVPPRPAAAPDALHATWPRAAAPSERLRLARARRLDDAGRVAEQPPVPAFQPAPDLLPADRALARAAAADRAARPARGRRGRALRLSRPACRPLGSARAAACPLDPAGGAPLAAVRARRRPPG